MIAESLVTAHRHQPQRGCDSTLVPGMGISSFFIFNGTGRKALARPAARGFPKGNRSGEQADRHVGDEMVFHGVQESRAAEIGEIRRVGVR